MSMSKSPAPSLGHGAHANRFANSSQALELGDHEGFGPQLPRKTVAAKEKVTTKEDDRTSSTTIGRPRLSVTPDQQRHRPILEGIDQAHSNLQNLSRSKSFTFKRPASITSNGSGASTSKPLRKKPRVHDFSVMLRQAIGFYKGEELLPVYAVERPHGEIFVYVLETEDTPLAVAHKYTDLFAATEENAVDLHDVMLNKDIFRAYGNINQKSKSHKLQLIKNYLQSVRGDTSTCDTNISGSTTSKFEVQESSNIATAAPVESSISAADDHVPESSALEVSAGLARATEPSRSSAAVIFSVPADQVQLLKVGHHKTDSNVSVMAKLRRESSSITKTVLFEVHEEEADSSKYDFSCRAIHEATLLKDVIFDIEFQRNSLQEVKAAIISRLCSTHCNSSSTENASYTPTKRPRSQRTLQESLATQDSDNHPKTPRSMQQPFVSKVTPLQPLESSPDEGAASTISETIVVVSPVKSGAPIGNNVLGNVLLWLENSTIATKAAIAYEKQIVAKERTLDEERVAWYEERKRQEKSLAAEKQKLDDQIEQWKRGRENQKNELSQERRRLEDTKASVAAREDAINARVSWINLNLPKAEAGDSLATRQAKLLEDLKSLEDREKEIDKDRASRHEKADQIKQKKIAVELRETEVATREKKADNREELVTIREMEVAQRESNADAEDKLLVKRRKDVDLRIQAVQREETQRASNTKSLAQPRSVPLLKTAIKPLDLENKTFEHFFKQVSVGGENAGNYRERNPHLVEDFVFESGDSPKDYQQIRILQNPIFVDGVKQQRMVRAGSRSYLVFESHGLSKYLETKPEMVIHEGKIFMCWKLLKEESRS